MVSFLSLNRNLRNANGHARAFRLPAGNPFPKLERSNVRPVHSSEAPARLSRPVAGRAAPVKFEDNRNGLPEMTTDVIDVSAGYAVENVKRERSQVRSLSRELLGLWVERVFGSHRAAHL